MEDDDEDDMEDEDEDDLKANDKASNPLLVNGGFGSLHPGGANFCLASGAVTFISESVDVELFENLGNRADLEMMGDFGY